MTLEKLLQENDGSNRELRDVQVQALTAIYNNWNPKSHFVLKAPVATGKSLILRAAQRNWGGSIITPTNQLVSQYEESYPTLNKLIGSQLYKCPEFLTNCAVGSMRYGCKGSVDTGCCLAKSREKFQQGQPTILNTMSAFVNRARMRVSAGLNYVDEAHTLCSTVRTLASTTVKFGPTERSIMKQLKFEKADLTSEIKMVKYLNAKADRFRGMLKKATDPDDVQKYYEISENAQFVADAIAANPEVFVIEFSEGTLRVLPVFAPRAVLDKILGTGGIVASGTMLPESLKELLGNKSYAEYECRSPIPAERRKVIYDPADCKFDYANLSPAKVAEKILDIYERKGRQSVFVHASYSLAAKLQEFLFGSHVLFHSKETKMDVLAEFRERGGIMIGSGLSTGLDLAGPKFQTQIITQLMFPNIGDLYVKKRRAVMGGENWYKEETALTWLQAIGRTTRYPEDKSETFMIDSRFPWVYKGWKQQGLISQDVDESVIL